MHVCGLIFEVWSWGVCNILLQAWFCVFMFLCYVFFFFYSGWSGVCQELFMLHSFLFIFFLQPDICLKEKVDRCRGFWSTSAQRFLNSRVKVKRRPYFYVLKHRRFPRCFTICVVVKTELEMWLKVHKKRHFLSHHEQLKPSGHWWELMRIYWL